MAAKIKPLYDRVLVKRIESEQKSAGGIIIPDTAQEKTQIGVVEAVGEGKLLADGKIRPLNVKVGDKVIFGKYSGTEFKFVVQFVNDNGTLFKMGPCCGASEEDMPTKSDFEYIVKKDNNGFIVITGPVYTP